MEEIKESKIYNYKGRVIIRSFLTIFTIVAMVSGTLAAYVLAMVGPDQIMDTKNAEDTQRFATLMDMEIQGFQDSLKIRNVFEQNGELSNEKTVDITNPYEVDESKKNKNTTFLVKDLTTMRRDGILNLAESICFDFNEGLYIGNEEEEFDDYRPMLSKASQAQEEENYILDRMSSASLPVPISGQPLLEYAKNNEEGISLYQLCNDLVQMNHIMSDYDEVRTWSSEACKNLRYYIQDNVGDQVITNGGWKSLDEARKIAQEWNVIIEYKRDADGVVILPNSNEGLVAAKQRLKQNNFISEDELVIITVDKNYPVVDQFSEFEYGYNYLKPHFMALVCMALASLVIAIICFILATMTTGQSERKGEVRLNIFDSVPTEIGATIVCVLGLLGLGFNIWIYDTVSYSYSTGAVNIIYVVAMLLTAVLTATWGYLSLVRRIKAKALWENSLGHRGVKIVKKIYRAGKMSVRLVIAFGGFVIAHVFLIAVLGMVGVILLLMADAAILIYLLKEAAERQKVKDGLDTIASGDLDYKIDTDKLQQDNKEMAEAANKIGDGLQRAVAKSMKNERMRSELITNVSHDIKTPLTSIINYVDLLKREDIQNPQVKGYIDILDAKSQRLKHLTEDLVEASKVSSGNVELHMDNLFVQELLQQAQGEFGEKLATRKLELVSTLSAEPVIIKADGRQMWRIFENLLNNIAKYALEGTRVYVDLNKEDKKAVLMFKNMSQEALNINANELTERFVRGDISRTTEGSGLGLSIAKSLTELQGGKFDIYLDGDLFKVTITFDTV